MVEPNEFEKAILDAAWNAQKFHIEMTGGEYLWYSHESFLQNFIAREVFNNTEHCGLAGEQQPSDTEWNKCIEYFPILE